MSLFKKQSTYYLSVCFLHSQRAYTYKTADQRITVNDVVLVPVGEHNDLKPAIVSRVETTPPPYYPSEKIKPIMRLAPRRDWDQFRGVDMRMKFDISYYRKEIDGTVQTFVTTAEQWARLRKAYAGDRSLILVEEKYPEPAQQPAAASWMEGDTIERTD